MYHFRLWMVFFLLLATSVRAAEKKQYPYQDKKLSAEGRADDLLHRMKTEEKVAQISAQLLFYDQFFEERDHTKGHILLNAVMGSTYTKALETNGVVATPKHYVDNYGEGGHDS